MCKWSRYLCWCLNISCLSPSLSRILKNKQRQKKCLSHVIFLSCFHGSALPSKWHLEWHRCCSYCSASNRVYLIQARQLVIHSSSQNVLENTCWVSPRKASSSLFSKPATIYLLLTTHHQDLTVREVSVLWYTGTGISSLSSDLNTQRKMVMALRTKWEPPGPMSTTS